MRWNKDLVVDEVLRDGAVIVGSVLIWSTICRVEYGDKDIVTPERMLLRCSGGTDEQPMCVQIGGVERQVCVLCDMIAGGTWQSVDQANS